MRFVLDYLYASYYKQNKQYDRALEKYSNLLKKSSRLSNQHIQLNLQQKAQLLSKLGQTDQACLIYQTTWKYCKISLDNLSYVRQINELPEPSYQIDRKSRTSRNED